ncbi:acetate/propionate family kinase [Candidatus Fokinia crypta]|uniref:Acetate kinase n=1 Tax=Candidatus Fokinia crypta TaxID=1920990 RepID=A0ABZ0USW2_9RICK|nr:acetate/propionate family kinase [Candidatus Fokinia cryptica]WPX98010.1 Acetate kinase [Candidatus Fokinia cryptica]
MVDYILVANTGSSSLKITASPFNKDQGIDVVMHVDFLLNSTSCSVKYGEFVKDIEIQNGTDAINFCIEYIQKHYNARFIAMGHRVLHGGTEMHGLLPIDVEVLAKIKELVKFGPLHQPYALENIEKLKNSNIPQYAYFDTSFHRTIPMHRRVYPIPQQYTKDGIIKYGFHGIAYESAMYSVSNTLPGKADSKIVIVHMGSGVSACAISEGKSVDTTMGLTPLDGFMMGTRCGAIDPAIPLLMQEIYKISAIEIHRMLNKDSGLKAISGISNDMRKLLNSNSESAKFAIEVFMYKAVKEISGLIAILGGVDVLVFSGGIGENSSYIRKRIVDGLSVFGLLLDDLMNEKCSTLISPKSSKTDIIIAKVNEESIIIDHIRTFIQNNR